MGFLQWRLLPLGAILLLVLGPCAGSSHSLRYFDMAVWEPGWRVPRFTALVYVNNQLIGRYDRDTRECVPLSSWIGEIHKDNAHFWARNTEWDFASTLVVDLMILKNLYNRSHGIQTLQVIFGCKLSGNNRTTRGFVNYGYNGRDFLSLDQETLTWVAMDAEANRIKRKWDAQWDRQKFWEFFLRETCVEGLRTHLRHGEEVLLKKKPPKVKVMRKVGYNGLETLVCRIYGFYPKEIDVTWWKDGEDQKPDTFTGGVIPNLDGTYHTWLSIDVDPKERDRFRCHVEHNSLLEPLNLAWKESVASSVFNSGLTERGLVGVAVAAILLGPGIIFRI